MTMLLDPLAKVLLSRFGGLSAVAYFEMANRMVSQARSLIASANQVLVPYYSKVAETTRGRIQMSTSGTSKQRCFSALWSSVVCCRYFPPSPSSGSDAWNLSFCSSRSSWCSDGLPT